MKLIFFYVFAMITIASRSILMTLYIILTQEEQKDKTNIGWYWLVEAGSYTYILTGDVIIIFLIDLLVRLSYQS